MDISPTARIRLLITTKEPIKTTLSFRSETRQNINVSNNTSTTSVSGPTKNCFNCGSKLKRKYKRLLCLYKTTYCERCVLRVPLNNTLTTEMLKVNADHDTHTKKGTKYRYRIKSNKHSSTTQLQISKSIYEVTCTYDVLVTRT